MLYRPEKTNIDLGFASVNIGILWSILLHSRVFVMIGLSYLTADNQLNAKSRLSKDVHMQHFRFHKEDAVNVNNVYLFRIYRWIFTYTESKSKI